MNVDLKNDSVVKKDRLRFTKNKMSANLTYLAILFNALYFVNLYTSDVNSLPVNIGTFYFNISMGASVVYNLLFMLIAFLASEEVKSYKMSFAYVLIILGAGQIGRIFYLPAGAKAAPIKEGEAAMVMGDQQFMWICIFLGLSAACCIIAGIVGIIKTGTLVKFQAELAKKGSSV